MTSLRILVVDPDPAQRDVLREVAARLGHEVVEAASGEEAIAVQATAAADLAVVSGGLTGIDVPELVTILKGRAGEGRFPILVVGSAGDASRRFASFDSGADEWLQGPLHPSDAESRLRCFARVVELAREIERLQGEIDQLTSRDPETGTYGRRFIHTQARLEQNRAERYGEALSIVLLDLDVAATLRDSGEHGLAEEVLREVAARLGASMRRCDLTARIGFGRFMILMPNTSTVGAYFAAEKVRDLVIERPFITSGKRVPLQATIGVSTYQEGNFSTPGAFIDSVEAALAQARTRGPGSVVLFHPVTAGPGATTS